MNYNNYSNSPYTFDGSSNNPNMYCAGQSSRRDVYNVRDCMNWPASLGDNSQQQRARGVSPGRGCVAPYAQPFSRGDQFYGQGAPAMSNASPDQYVFHTGATNEYGTGEPIHQAVQQSPIKAYMSTPGEGGSNGKPIQIPCHTGGGAGQIPDFPNMPALGYKVTIPQIPPTPPVDFEIRQ